MFYVKFINILITFLIIVTSSYSASAQIDIENFGQCFTPNRERGLCIYLEQCGDLYDLLQKKPLLDEDRAYLTRSQCSKHNGKVLVCCPSRSIRPGERISIPAHTQGPSRVTNRPNQPTFQQPSRGGNGNKLPSPPTCGGGLHDKIYGGNLTKIDEYPWMALIEYTKPNGKGFHCGGSLINNRYVITASHCVLKIPSGWELTGVRLGEWDTSTTIDCDEGTDCAAPVQDISVEKKITHDRYDRNAKAQYNDIALLRLSREVQYSDWIKPICLPIASHLRSADVNGVSLDVSGWGKTEFRSSSNIKLKARVDGLDARQCNQIYNKQNVVLDDTQLCAGGERGIDSCSGDSGGPLIRREDRPTPYYYLVGIVSFGPTPCGLEGWPGVYTRVGSYVNWIQANLEP